MKKITILFLFTLLVTGYANAQINLGNGLSASYPFSGNANDVSGNNLNGTVHNATLMSDRFGVANSAYFYNGSTSYINFGNILNTVFEGTGNKFSISVWVKPYINMTGNGILTKDADGACSESENEIVLSIYNQKVMFIYSSSLTTGNSVYATGAINITDTSHWYHIALLYDGTINSNALSRVKIYIDDVQDVISAAIPETGILGNIQAGTAAFGTGTTLTSSGTACAATTYTFHGGIDDIRIYNRQLDSAEIYTLYHGPTNVGISENENNSNFSIFPNPSSNIFNLVFENITVNGSIKVFNSLGQEVYDKEIKNNSTFNDVIDLTGKPKGIYYIKLNSEKSDMTKKLILID